MGSGIEIELGNARTDMPKLTVELLQVVPPIDDGCAFGYGVVVRRYIVLGRMDGDAARLEQRRRSLDEFEAAFECPQVLDCA